MIDKILVLVPTRRRPASIDRLRRSFLNTHTNKSELLVILDEDDEGNYCRYENLKYETYNGEIGYCQEKMNSVAIKYCHEYRYIGFIGDDNEFITEGWDSKIFSALSSVGENSIAYINDQLQDYCTVNMDCCRNVFLDSSIVKKLGYFAPHCLRHFYQDNFWFSTGTELNTLVYLDQVKVKHWHYLVGTAKEDEVYKLAYRNNKIETDRLSYETYKKTQRDKDIKKLLNK